MNIYIIGSLSQKEVIEKTAEMYKEMGNDVKYVQPENKSLSEAINDCLKIIENWAHLVVAVPKQIYPEITLGDGVTYEIEYARHLGTPVVIQYPNKRYI